MPTNKELDKEVKRLSQSVARMVDEVFLLKSELKKFKKDVASDVEYLTQQSQTTNK